VADLSDNDITKLRALIRWVRNFKITGANVTGRNGPGGASYHIGASNGAGGKRPSSDFYGHFAITSATQDGSNWRWAYAMAEHEKSTAGYGGWTAKSGGNTITAYNYAEEDNGTSGLLGNGMTVDSDGQIATTDIEVQPIPTAKGVHRVYAVTLTSGATEYWFTASNAMDGECE
jgi:hypothetical protein